METRIRSGDVRLKFLAWEGQVSVKNPSALPFSASHHQQR
jgi:hypothetical protein